MSDRRELPVIDAVAPPERLAVFRILCGSFVVVYFCVRAPVFVQLADRSSVTFRGVGLWWFREVPFPGVVPLVLLAAVISSGIAATLGYRYRFAAPVFAAAVLLLSTYRSSWGQLLHFENLFTLHLLVLAFVPAADAWSLDARRRMPGRRHESSYGFPLALCGVIVVITYVLAGVAKLRYGGVDWVTGDTLQNHIAYSAARLELLGGTPSPLASPLIGRSGALSWFAGLAVAIELAAPLAFAGPRVRGLWVAAAWSLHAGILAAMFIAFPYPLFLVAFAPFFRVEEIGYALIRWTQTAN